MSQLTIRVPEELVARLRDASAARGQSMNGWISAILAAAVDPETATDEGTRVRERLARAGLLARSLEPMPTTTPRPDKSTLDRARAAAARGRSLAELVTEGRR